jgi:hypothetical protein
VPLLGNVALIAILALMIRDSIRDRAEVAAPRKPHPLYDREFDPW